MYKINDVSMVGQLYLPSLSAFSFYVCVTLKIAHTVDNQNFETALTLQDQTKISNFVKFDGRSSFRYCK